MPIAPSLRASVYRLAVRGSRLPSDPRPLTTHVAADGDQRRRRSARGALSAWLTIACASLLLAAGAARAQTTTFEVRVAASLDDAEQFADSSMYYNSSDLELIHDTSDQIVGMRWVSLAIPPGSTITAAWIQFSAKESQSEVTNLNFRGQATDAAPAFSGIKNNIGARPRTSSVVTWSPPAWTAGQIGAGQQTPDLKSVIQEVVSRPGWALNNPLVIIVNGTGHRTTWAWDGNPAQAPLLHVEYTNSSPPPNQPPVGALAVTQSASPPLTVSASAAGSTDTDAFPIAGYTFDWGDGSTATVVNAPTQTASHTYSAAGTYTVTLTVKDTGGLTSTPKTQSITVSAANQPPVGALAVTQSASPPLTVSASAAGSTDTDAFPIASYSFDWGDGNTATVVSAPTQTASHTYAAAGTYTVTLTVKDTGGLTSTPKTQSISVAAPNQPPVAALAVTQLPSPALTVSANAAGSTDTDAWPIASYSFDWGDGSTATVVNAPATSAQHTYSAAGTYTVTLTVKDTGGLTSTPKTQSIAVAAPTVTTVETRIAVSSDDAEQLVSNGSMYLNSSDLELIQDGSDQIVGMRWPGLTIPPGATITAAYIQFVSKEAWSVATSLTLKAQAADNAVTFTTATSNVSSRPVTNASAAWAPMAWNVGDAGLNQRTPDLSALVQEVVSRPAWASGNALVIIVSGSGHRTAWASDGSPTQAPLLHVEYTSSGSQPPPVDLPPVAQLAVTQVSSPPLTVTASAAGSTDTDSTPIASYSFDWGDGSTATVVNAPTQSATHTYASAGTYAVTLTAKDTGGLTSSPVTSSITVNPPAQGGGNVAVYVGYYDTHHPSNLKTKPSPWLGSPSVTFVGKDDDGKGNWDSSALRVDNLTGADLTNVVVTCDIGSNHYALWGTRTIPANGKLIMAQTAFQNFDGSDTSPAGCYGCDPKLCLTKVVSTIPVIHVAVGGTTTNYYDNTQVINTKGADGAGCPDTGGTRNDESQPWKQIGTSQSIREGGPENEDWIPDQMTFDAPAPNPVRDWMVIRYSVPGASRVFVGFYDVAGRLVQIVLDREMPAGIYQQGVTLGGVKPGVYYAQVQTRFGSMHRPVVVSR